MDDIIRQKFSEWTKGLNGQGARIAVFEHIRDIPYAIVPELRDPKRGPCGILEYNKGSCQPKHYLLALLFKEMGIIVKYATYPFKWKDCPIKYPAEIKEIVNNLPSAYHLAAKAYLNNKWVLVDATNDLLLKKGGFPVNEKWDGASDTLNAVVPSEEILHDTPEERIAYELSKRSLYTEKEKALYAQFIDKLNSWLVELRK